MLIIFEGANKAGKSSIIRNFSEIESVYSIYNRDILKEMNDVKQETYISALAMLGIIKDINPDKSIILDRFHLSEIVYGKRVRDYDNYNMWIIDDMLAAMDCMLITVKSQYNHIKDVAKLEEYFEIQEEFIKLHKQSRIKNKMLITLEDIL